MSFGCAISEIPVWRICYVDRFQKWPHKTQYGEIQRLTRKKIGPWLTTIIYERNCSLRSDDICKIRCCCCFSESTYVVKLIKSPLPVDELNGSFLLRLTPTGIELLHDRTGCKIYFWPIETIRKFGDDGRDVFCLDAGRRCGRWSGDFHFATESANDIRVQIGIIIQNIHAPQIKKHEANKWSKCWSACITYGTTADWHRYAISQSIYTLLSEWNYSNIENLLLLYFLR